MESLFDLSSVLDTEKYPLIDGEIRVAGRDFSDLKDLFYQDGYLVLDGFVLPKALEKAVAEVDALQDQAFFQTVYGNAYLDDSDKEQPPEHARSWIHSTSLGVIAYDQIPTDNIMRQVYDSPLLTEFIRKIVGCEKLYHYACPLGAMNFAVMKDRDHLRWHFDQSDFVVSIPLQEALDGGKFECVRFIRDAKKENYSEVRRVLDGGRERVETLEPAMGSLVLFQGRNTIHQVTPVEGERPRLGALLGYAFDSETKSSEYLLKIRYGRSSVS